MTAGAKFGPLVSLKNLFEFRKMTLHLIRRDLKATYGSFVLGYAWTLLEPILFTMVFYLVFIILRGNPDELMPLSIMLGILIYSAFSKATSRGAQQLLRNTSLIHQVAFPREVLIANVSGFQLVRLTLSLLIAPLYMIYAGIPFTANLLLLPIAVFGIIILAHGCSLFLSIMSVYLRDTAMILEISLRALFFLSGVFYAAQHIPAGYIDYHMMNPIAVYIEIARAAIMGDTSFVPLDVILRCIGVTLIIWIFGAIIFNRYQSRVVVRL